MAKTHLFKKLRQLLQSAYWAELNDIPDQEFFERREAFKERRIFLKKSLIFAGASAALPLLNSCRSLTSPTKLASTEDQVTIIGAGAAGLAAAYTLSKEGYPFTIFEGSSRVGGRIFTLKNFNSDAQFVECGAELVDSNHETLNKLASELGLVVEDFTEFDKGVTSQLFYFNKRFYSESEVLEGLKPLVLTTAAIAKKISATRLAVSYHSGNKSEVLTKYDQMSLKAYLANQQKFCPPWALNLIEAAYVSELGVDSDQISSLTFISMFSSVEQSSLALFGDSSESRRIQGGNSKLIEALHGAIGGDTKIQFEHKLTAIKETSKGLRLTFDTPGGPQEFFSSRVVLALPLTTLRNVHGINNLEISPQKKKFISELGYGANSKLMFDFKTRIWRKKNSHREASTGTAFGDFAAQSFWETSRLQKGKSGIITNFSGGEFAKNLSHANLGQVLSDFQKIHPDASKALAGNQILMNWSKNPFSESSYASIRPGQYLSLWGAGAEPELNGRLVLAGEHTSEDFQGFMNGAYESGIRAAHTFMKTKVKNRSRA